MRLRPCRRKAELTTVLRDSRWPLGADSELRDHVALCKQCSDLALVMTAFQEARAEVGQIRLPAPGLLWWRAHLLRRRRALQTAMRPIMIAEIAALTVVLVALLLSGWRLFEANATPDWFSNMQRSFSPAVLIASDSPAMLAVAALTMMVLACALVLYVAVARDS